MDPEKIIQNNLLSRLINDRMRNLKRSLRKYGALCWLLLLFQALPAQCPDPIKVEVVVAEPPCFGGNQGGVNGRITGGNPPYKVELSGMVEANLTVTSNGGVYFFGGLVEGSYNIMVRDAGNPEGDGCSTKESFMISAPPELVLEVSGESISCSDDGESKLTGKITGGTSPYTLFLNGVATTPTSRSITAEGFFFEIDGLEAGTYFVRVVDGNYVTSGNGAGCTTFRTASITAEDNTTETSLDVELCQGERYQLGTQTLTTSGTYQETFIASTGCDSIVTVNLKVKAGEPLELVPIPEKDTLCTAETTPISVEVFGGAPGYDIRWYDNLAGTGTPIGSEETVFVNPMIGLNNYLIRVSDADNCTITDTVTLSYLPIDVTITPQDTSICSDAESLTLSVKNNDPAQILTYAWTPENAIVSDPSASTVMVDLADNSEFSVLITDQNGCETTLTTAVNADICASLAIVADPPAVIPGGSSVLTVTGCEDCELLWSTGATGSSITVTPAFTTTYSVSVTAPGGCDCDVLEETVVISDCLIDTEDLFVPNAFTPDGDQINDELCVRSQLEILPPGEVEMSFMIYNRWGQELFRSTSFSDCWDGTFRGSPVAPDVYGYHLEVTCPGNSYSLKGDVTVIR